MQARVGPVTGPADVEKAKALLGEFRVTPLTEFLEAQIGTKATASPFFCHFVGRWVGRWGFGVLACESFFVGRFTWLAGWPGLAWWGLGVVVGSQIVGLGFVGFGMCGCGCGCVCVLARSSPSSFPPHTMTPPSHTQPPRNARTPDPKFYKWDDKLLKGDDLEFINFFNWALPYMKIHKGNETKFIDECAAIGKCVLLALSRLGLPTQAINPPLPTPTSTPPPPPTHLPTGVKSGKYTDLSALPPDTLDAMTAGMHDAFAFIFDPANAAKARTPFCVLFWLGGWVGNMWWGIWV